MIKKIAILLLCALLSSCSTVETVNEYMPWYSGNEVQSIGLKVNSGAAMRYAVSVDIVFAYDENLLALLTNVSSQQWFQEKRGYLASYGPNMDVLQRQIVPGYSELIEVLPGRSVMAKGVFAFAFYPNNPNAKAVLSAVATPWLIFDATQMTLVSAAPAGIANNSGGNL